MEFLDFLDALEELIEDGRHVPGTNKTMIERGQAAAMIDRIRAAIPQDMHKADEIRSRGESIVSGAVMMAKKIRSEAERDHQQRIEESEIVTAAQQRAQEVHEVAEQDAKRIRQRANTEAVQRIRDADGYTASSLEKLARQVLSVRERVQELENELGGLERAVEVGTRYLQARWAREEQELAPDEAPVPVETRVDDQPRQSYRSGSESVHLKGEALFQARQQNGSNGQLPLRR